ncbi:hypothetical protein ACCP41_004308 [Escherichia coli]|uniref:hypothetical protein n=1 Tax=Escherichia coli TaxID=562 RepID=UPI0011408A3A|nr:hypothetical protein [Escherichia coli]EFI4641600.1 hypothetical protein [Escherichia coli]EKD2570631.1 hypothetical protein [Escherichia coli]EKG5187701.1 hypothetical protein [Escherichia coli]EKP1647033.1 hypothetical protein [Escherichia coli]MCN3252768.1 hypothetical protein [Escherichia coli]
MNLPKRPIITFVFSVLLLMKVLSGLGSLAYTQQPITMIICVESFILAYVAVVMHIRSGGVKPLTVLLIIIIVLDVLTIVITDLTNEVDSVIYARLIGVEVWYILILLYFRFSKKFKAFKANEITANA